MASDITVITHTLADTIKYNNQNILSYKIKYPQFISGTNLPALDCINSYYKNKAFSFRSYAKSSLLSDALSIYKYNTAEDYPIFEYELFSDFNISLVNDCFISVYTDKYVYSGGAHGNTTRTSQTWDVNTGKELSLDYFFPNNPEYIEDIQSNILHQISLQIENNQGYYFTDYPVLVKNTFCPSNFYLTPTHIVVYFNEYDIAPYASGIVEFKLPLY